MTARYKAHNLLAYPKPTGLRGDAGWTTIRGCANYTAEDWPLIEAQLDKGTLPAGGMVRATTGRHDRANIPTSARAMILTPPRLGVCA